MNSLNLKLDLPADFKAFKIGFSLVELMISLITISCIVAAFTPVITKKLKKQDIAISIAQSSEIISPCTKDASGKFIQSTNENEDCQLCTSSKCIKCQKECGNGYYLDSNACDCISCDKFKGEGENGVCQTCTKNGCTLCKTTTGTWSRGYKIGDDKTCKKCPSSGTNLPSNGTNQCAVACSATLSSGYFCDNNGNKKLCSSVYSSYCATCDKTACKSCKDSYYLNDSNECKSCEEVMTSGICYICNKNVCTRCSADNVLSLDHKKCLFAANNSDTGKVGIYTFIPHCNYYRAKSTHSSIGSSGYGATLDDYECYGCKAGYFISTNSADIANSDNPAVQSSRTICLACGTITNCQYCSNDGKCLICNEGYYVNSSNKCSECLPLKSGASTYDEHCATCSNSGSCAICKQGYHLKNGKCIEDDNKFNCSDSNFIKIGNLCITRKNMGDSNTLAIPSSINVVDIGEYCYSNSTKCCWKGHTGLVDKDGNDSCDEKNGSYSGCNRTLCNWTAGEEICSQFNYAGKKWRMVKKEEISNWDQYTINLGDSGLQLCDIYASTPGITGCNHDWSGIDRNRYPARCLGSYGNACEPGRIWTSTLVGSGISASYYAITNGGNTAGSMPIQGAAGVRCVTEMN